MKCYLCNGTGITYDNWNKYDLCIGEGKTGILKKCVKCNGTGFLKAGMGQGMDQPWNDDESIRSDESTWNNGTTKIC